MDMTVAGLAAGLKRREFSSVELTRRLIARLEAAQPVLNALITPTPDIALEQAAR
ncbi:MAG: Asp-tRNA(Asn)/Glu-tRNA(Gln) amidotransferase subunit GatA, partial [Steroidobacteraceae bacterium]